ncbi:MAG: hypothetical protein CL774_03325 [Chloroflexi bacterium]|nr:hypothetical protein [Chloroflexota bacterium]
MNIDKYRHPENNIENFFYERWSSKLFKSKTIDKTQILSLFEAARWAPSSNNAQPWRFVYATKGEFREKINMVMNPYNRKWATKAPLIILVFSKNQNDGKENRSAKFDTGAAWMSIAIQAKIMGMNTRAMGGIDHDLAHKVSGLPIGEYSSICAIAVGFSESDDNDLSENIPSSRVKLEEFIMDKPKAN